MTSWSEAATSAWQAEEERATAEAQEQVEAAVEQAASWWRSVALGDDLPDDTQVHRPAPGLVVVSLPQLPTCHRVGLAVLEGRRGLDLAQHDGRRWHLAGLSGPTRADLGRVLTEELPAAGGHPDDAPPSTAELLQDVLEALVRDAVDERLGRT